MTQLADVRRAGTRPAPLPDSDGAVPSGVELRHLRYFVAVADAGTFTHAAERMYIAQPTLSQQIRRLEQPVGTPLLQCRREGVRLTEAGHVLLEESRAVLSLLDHGVRRTRQAAGLGRPRLRFVMPPYLPEAYDAWLTGVRNIKDNIEIGYDADPAGVAFLVHDALDRYALIPDGSDVAVDVSGNTVTLTGHVRTWAEHDAVIGATWMANGVNDIRDEIYVTG